MNSLDRAIQDVQQFFADKIKEHGAVAKGVDWKNEEAQFLRFEQLLKVVQDTDEPFSLLDYGCGYGALLTYLNKQGYDVRYVGFDITPEVIEAANQLFPQAHFDTTVETLAPMDYVVSSGIFNMKLGAPVDQWESYVKQVISEQWELCTKGMAFNCLTSYSDPEYMRDNLYYPDPKTYFDWCKRTFSRNVALLHDYGTYDWTMIVRK